MKHLKRFNESKEGLVAKELVIFEKILKDMEEFFKSSFSDEEITIDKVEENKFFAHILIEGDIIGSVEYHYSADNNPFYDGGEYPENRYIIELNNAFDENGVIDYDNIQLIKVSPKGNYDSNKLHNALEVIIDDAKS